MPFVVHTISWFQLDLAIFSVPTFIIAVMLYTFFV